MNYAQQEINLNYGEDMYTTEEVLNAYKYYDDLNTIDK